MTFQDTEKYLSLVGMAAILTSLSIYLKSTYREESDRRYGEEGRRVEGRSRLGSHNMDQNSSFGFRNINRSSTCSSTR